MKVFEVRDHATAMIALAVKLEPETPESARLLKAAGYGDTPEDYIVLVSIRGGVSEAQDDPYRWRHPRTMGMAHQMIGRTFDTLPDGAVIDVRVGYGEQDQPAPSDF